MCWKNLAHLFFMSYIYVALILRLRVADNLTRKKLLVLSVTVEAANLLYAYTTLLCDAHERLARLNLVVKLFARRAGRISAHFATVNLLSGVTAVANLATGSVSLSILAPDFDKMCTYKITYPNFQAFSKNNLCKWVTQRLFFVSLHHVCT